ncbi:phage antirepressor N-terminal domain-containing protein [Providencia rettgeri]
MNTISTINVPFHGNNLYVVNYNGEPYVPMKPIVDGMGLAWQSQLEKIKLKFKSTVTEIVIVAADGKERSMVCLAFRKFAAWLNSIMPNKVKPEIRDKVIQYQEECDDVLYEYWTTGEVKAKHKSTVQERNPLKNAVNLLVSKKGIMYPEVYSLVHQQFNVSGIDELTADQIPMAVEYVHKLVMEGEYIPKQQLPQVGLESLAMPMSFFDEYDWLFDLEGVDKAESLSEFYRYPQKMLKNMAEYPNPLIEMLTKLRGMGVNIDAAYFWLKALQHRYEVNTSSLNRKERLLSDVLLSNTSVAHNIIKSIIDEWRNILAPAIKKLNPALESEVTKQLSELNGVIYCNLLSLKEKPEAKLLA